MPTDSSIKRYKSVINVIEKTFKNGEIQASPEEILSFLVTKYPNPNSRRTALSALLHFHDKPEYRKAFAEIRVEAEAHQKSQVMSETKKENFMEWKNVLEVLKKVQSEYHQGKETLENLVILSLYVLQPPVRLDYSDMNFIATDTLSNDWNYAVLTGSSPSFVFNEYKTKSVYGKAILPISKKLLVLLQLFASKNPKLNISRDTLSKRIIFIFKKYAKKSMSVLMLRHSFITHFLAQNLNETLKEDMARMMLHSKNIQAFYNTPSGYAFQDDVSV